MKAKRKAKRKAKVTMEQVEEVQPPPNPAKETDARFKGYQETFGDESWELDALDPPYITALIGEQLEGLIDRERWKASEDMRDEARRLLGEVAAKWGKITKGL